MNDIVDYEEGNENLVKKGAKLMLECKRDIIKNKKYDEKIIEVLEDVSDEDIKEMGREEMTHWFYMDADDRAENASVLQTFLDNEIIPLDFNPTNCSKSCDALRIELIKKIDKMEFTF